VTAIASTTALSISVSWTDNSSNETSFEVSRSTDGINFTHLATTSADAANFIDTDLTVSTTYYYKVRAFNSFGYSTLPVASIMDTLPVPVRESQNITSTSTDYTVPSGGSNKLLVAFIETGSCDNISSISQNGQALTVVPIRGTANRAAHCVAYRADPQSGQFQINSNASTVVSYLLMTLQNAAQSNPIDAVNVTYNSNLTSSQTTSATTTVANDLLLSRSFYAGPNLQANYDVTVSSYGTGEVAVQPVQNYTTAAAYLGPDAGTYKYAGSSPGVETMVTNWSLQGDIDEAMVAIKPAQ
jgi:hypothetical protein